MAVPSNQPQNTKCERAFPDPSVQLHTLYLHASFHRLMYTPWWIASYDSWNRWKFGGSHAVSDFWFIYLFDCSSNCRWQLRENAPVLFLETDTRLWGLNCFMDRLPRQDFIVTFVCFFVNKLGAHPGMHLNG